MLCFTIETTYRLPLYRQRTYEAETLEAACRRAIEDDDWSDLKEDYDCSGDTYVTGAWLGDVAPYSVPALPIPSHFLETLQRKADHFEAVLGMLKVLAQAAETGSREVQLWRRHATAAIAKAEAILAHGPDPA
jgi:hypothetical protein